MKIKSNTNKDKQKFMKISICLFIFLYSFCFSQSFAQKNEKLDAYKTEEQGYFAHLTMTNKGVVATDNYASKLYLLQNGKLDELIATPGCGRYYTVSPDKNKIGFKLILSDGTQIPAVFDLTTNKINKLHIPVDLCGQVSFSDNGKIAFTVNNDLYVTDGINTQTYDLKVYSNIAPISPNAKFVVFNNNSDQLHIINLFNKEIIQITDNKYGYVYPKWSPDGNKLVFSTLSGNLFVWDCINRNTYFIGQGGSPDWSEDSQYLIYQRSYVKDFEFKGSDIFLSKYDGTKTIDLTKTKNTFEMCPIFGLNNNIIYHTYNKREMVSSKFDLQKSRLYKKQIILKKKQNLEIKFYNTKNFTQKSTKSITHIPGDAPYISQLYDVPDFHNGSGSCAPSTAVMAVGYYNRLPKWPTQVSSPYTHTSDYGSYVADKYRYNEIYYDDYSSTKVAWGAYAHMWVTYSSPSNNGMQSYIENHNMTSNHIWTSSCTFSYTTDEIDLGYPHPICSWLSTAGHLTLTVGYVNGQHTLIFNDPYGNKNTSPWSNYTPTDKGINVYYDWPGYNNGYANLDADETHGGVAWTVKARTSETTYNDTIIDDIYYEHGFYMNNQEPSHMRYFHDQNAGYNGHTWWTITMDSQSDVAWVKWTPNIPEHGEYEVFAYIPNIGANAADVIYKIYYDGDNTSVVINQNSYSDEWVSLGTYPFEQGQYGYVYLGDSTGISGDSIAYDAMKWHKISSFDNIPPTSLVNVNGQWQTTDFLAYFTDNDDSAGTGIDKKFYQPLEYTGTEWRANKNNGFFNDNFEYSINPDWTVAPNAGIWLVNNGHLRQLDQSVGNSNIYTQLEQNAPNEYLYHWSALIDGLGTNRRCGLHIFVSDSTLPNRGNSYLIWFLADYEKVRIYKTLNDTLYLKAENPININTGVWYDFKTIYNPVTGNIQAFIDNSQVASWTDSLPITSGKYISLRNGDSDVQYDDIKVYKSRQDTAFITVGTNINDDVRFQNPNPSAAACRIKSVVTDSVGNFSVAAGLDVNIDWTQPDTGAYVYDGINTDIDTTNFQEQLSANWSAFQDTNSEIKKYLYSIGISQQDTSIVGWTDNGLDTNITKNSLTLISGQTYYFNIKAENNALLFSDIISSDGQTYIDTSDNIKEISNDFNLTVYPNPFNDNVIITYTLKKQERVKISLTDIPGREIIIADYNNQGKGNYKININTKELGIHKGIYLLKFSTKTKNINIHLVKY